ncbi:MAG: APC family permease [Trebonia sp.]|uniref:APC family permease n=1 Tax=Trebonia sp. TaxID=2767075 RepID=UPI003BAF346E
MASLVGAVHCRLDRGRDLAHGTRGQAVDRRGGRGRGRSGGDHARGLPPCPGRSACRAVGHTEESRDPRRTIPRALYLSVAIAAVLLVFFAYATITGFRYNVSSIGRSSVPFLTMADHYLGGAAILAWIAGILSVLATLIAGADSQSRLLFDGGRTGLLPAKLGHVHSRSGTPVNALLFMTAAGLGIIGIWWVSHLVTGDTGSMDPVGLYAECSTMATIVILFVYFLTMLSLPVFMWRRHRASFSLLRHVVIPVLGSATLIVPFVELCQPGQPAPYNAFPFIALALVAAIAVIAWLVVRRHPHAGAGEGAEA